MRSRNASKGVALWTKRAIKKAAIALNVIESDNFIFVKAGRKTIARGRRSMTLSSMKKFLNVRMSRAWLASKGAVA